MKLSHKLINRASSTIYAAASCRTLKRGHESHIIHKKISSSTACFASSTDGKGPTKLPDQVKTFKPKSKFDPKFELQPDMLSVISKMDPVQKVPLEQDPKFDELRRSTAVYRRIFNRLKEKAEQGQYYETGVDLPTPQATESTAENGEISALHPAGFSEKDTQQAEAILSETDREALLARPTTSSFTATTSPSSTTTTNPSPSPSPAPSVSSPSVPAGPVGAEVGRLRHLTEMELSKLLEDLQTDDTAYGRPISALTLAHVQSEYRVSAGMAQSIVDNFIHPGLSELPEILLTDEGDIPIHEYEQGGGGEGGSRGFSAFSTPTLTDNSRTRAEAEAVAAKAVEEADAADEKAAFEKGGKNVVK